MAGKDKIPLEVIDKLPDYFQKKFEKIKFFLREEGVKPSNIKQVIAGLEMDRLKLKQKMTEGRKLMGWAQDKDRHRIGNPGAINLMANDLKEKERALIDMNEKIQTMRAIGAGLKRRGVDIARVGVTVEDVKRLKAMHEEGQKVSREALGKGVRRG